VIKSFDIMALYKSDYYYYYHQGFDSGWALLGSNRWQVINTYVLLSSSCIIWY